MNTHVLGRSKCFVDKEQRTAENMEEVAEKQALKMHWYEPADDLG